MQKIIAKIPAGYTLESISNQMGTGYKHEFLTSRAGTGKYETYLIKTTCGATGSFESGGHIHKRREHADGGVAAGVVHCLHDGV